jgi:predicted transcriptional regulator
MIQHVDDIRKARKSVDWTQKDLAAATGLSQSAIAKIEKGRYSIPHDTFVKISEALDRKNADLGNLLTIRDVMRPAKELITLRPKDSVGRAITLMTENGISQIPIFDGDRVIGTATSHGMMKFLSESGSSTQPVKDAMERELPLVNEDAPVSSIKELDKEFHAVLATRAGKVVGIVTSEDVLRASLKNR